MMASPWVIPSIKRPTSPSFGDRTWGKKPLFLLGLRAPSSPEDGRCSPGEGARLGKVGEQVAEEPRPNSFSSGHVTRSGVLPPPPRFKLALFFFFYLSAGEGRSVTGATAKK